MSTVFTLFISLPQTLSNSRHITPIPSQTRDLFFNHYYCIYIKYII